MSPLRLMLLTYIMYFCGRCYCHNVLADVIANDFVEDVKAHILFTLFGNKCVGWCYCLWQMEWPLQGELSLWQMLLPRVLILLQFEFRGVKSEPHPRYEADGICLCFYWGMDYWPLCYSAFLIALLRFCSSLPYDVEIINGDLMTSDVAMVIKPQQSCQRSTVHKGQ